MIRKLLLAAALVAVTWPVVAQASWVEASSAHFLVYSDAKPDRVRDFAQRLEKFDRVLRLLREIPETPISDAQRVRVYMTGDIHSIGALYSRGNSASGVAGFYQSRVGGPVAFVPADAPKGMDQELDAQSILFHEYTHHFMFMTYPDTVFPSWLVEGFAEFNATAIFEPNGDVTIGQMPAYRAFTVADSTILPARRVLEFDHSALRGIQVDALYARGWLLTHFLTFEPSRRGQLNQYIAAINSGKSAEEATSIFGDLKKLDREMTDYLLRSKIAAMRLTNDKIVIGPVALRAMTAGEAAVMPAVLQTTRGVDPAMAQVTVKLARKLAAPYPNDAGAQNELAEAEYDAHNLPEADAAASRALAADPKSIHALIYKGMVATARLADAKDTDPAHWRDARGWFVRANAVDPDNPRPLMLYYNSFAIGHLAPTKNAEDGLLSAYSEAPFALDLRMTAADIFLHRGDLKSARVALLPVAYSPHRGGLTAKAVETLAAIDGNDVPGAIKRLEAKPEDKDADKKKGG